MVIGDLISQSQSGFIPGRNISDNIIVAQDVVRNYHRGSISPRCAIKVDVKKDYDTNEMGFYYQGS